MFKEMTNGKDGQITRDEIANQWRERGGRSRRNEEAGNTPSPAPPKANNPLSTPVQPLNQANTTTTLTITPASTSPTSRLAELEFQRRDRNGDGYLDSSEMPDELRAELNRWDTNRDGLIDVNEYKAWYEARRAQRQLERDQAQRQLERNQYNTVVWQNGWNGANPGTTSSSSSAENKPPVYRAGKLPKELQPPKHWFTAVDTDNDGQISLCEWRKSGRPLEEFYQIDRNGDGFLTIEEVLAYEKSRRDVKQANRSSGERPSFVVKPNSTSNGSQNGNVVDGQYRALAKPIIQDQPASGVDSAPAAAPPRVLDVKPHVKPLQLKLEEFRNQAGSK
jgi:Ca2+-binding EF-hand superfamily protein